MAQRAAGVRRVIATVGLVLGTLLVLAPGAAWAEQRAGGATPPGSAWLRLAHLAPDTGAVDVWLTPFGGAAGPATVSGVTYGAVSSYRALTPGFYSIAMRPTGASVTTPAMLTSTVEVAEGKAYTVAAEGTGNTLSVRLTPDDLTAPAAGRARVRLIQASTSAAAVDVRVVQGPTLASQAAYGAVTRYTEVPQGRWTLQVSGSTAGTPATLKVDLAAGSVNTVLLLNGPAGAFMVRAIVDARGATAMPKGGVETGGGGLADADQPDSGASLGTPVAALLAVGSVGLLAVGRRRAAAPARP